MEPEETSELLLSMMRNMTAKERFVLLIHAGITCTTHLIRFIFVLKFCWGPTMYNFLTACFLFIFNYLVYNVATDVANKYSTNVAKFMAISYSKGAINEG